MIKQGLLGMIPRYVNDRMYFPLFENILSTFAMAKPFVLDPILSYISGFVPFWDYQNDYVVYENFYHDESWIDAVQGDMYFTYYNEVIKTDEFANLVYDIYIGFDYTTEQYKKYWYFTDLSSYDVFTQEYTNTYWGPDDESLSPQEMYDYNLIYEWSD